MLSDLAQPITKPITVLAITRLEIFNHDLRLNGIRLIAIVPTGRASHPDDMAFDFFSDPKIAAGFVRELCDRFRPDVIFQDDDSSPLLHAGLEDLGVPKVWYAIDSHLHAWHKHFASVFDFVFHAQKNRASEFRHFQKNSAWLPLCMTRGEVAWVPWEERERNVVFVGSLDEKRNPARVALLKAVQDSGIAVDILQGEFKKIYAHAKVVINQSVNKDLNFRFFEATGCGALLITDSIGHSQSDFLTPGEDFLVYQDAEDLAAKIRWAMDHPDIAKVMARKAYDKIQAGHLTRHRAWTLTEKLRQVANDDKAHTPRDFARAQLAFAFQLCSMVDYPQTLFEFFQSRAELLMQAAHVNPVAKAWTDLSQGAAFLIRREYRAALEKFQSMDSNYEDEWLNQYLRHFKLAAAHALRDLHGGP